MWLGRLEHPPPGVLAPQVGDPGQKPRSGSGPDFVDGGIFPRAFHTPDKYLIVGCREASCGLPFISNKNNNNHDGYHLRSASHLAAFISPDPDGSLKKEALNRSGGRGTAGALTFGSVTVAGTWQSRDANQERRRPEPGAETAARWSQRKQAGAHRAGGEGEVKTAEGEGEEGRGPEH